MKPITLILEDRVGLISDISYILGKEKINIDGLNASAVGKKIAITIRVKQQNKALAVLAKNGYKNVEKNYFIITIDDKPGEMAKITGLLKKAKINIVQLHQVSSGENRALVCIETNKPRATEKILAPYMAEELVGKSST